MRNSLLTPDVKSIKVNDDVFLTMYGVAEEYQINKYFFYKLTRTRKLRYMYHPSYGRCVKREWVSDYFNTQKNFIVTHKRSNG